MNKKDLLVAFIVLIVLSPFFLSSTVFNAYISFNAQHGMITSFIKFALLASFGEILALRIKEKKYWKPNFGLLPKLIVWGIIGLTIKVVFTVFATGVPNFLEYMGMKDVSAILSGSLSIQKVIVAFAISTTLNLTYAPVMMTAHKITDLHIAHYQGSIFSFFKPIDTARILKDIDWQVLWGFVLKKTIPLFWIPVHIITFLLPPDFQVLFAAALSIMLGLILTFASLKSEK